MVDRNLYVGMLTPPEVRKLSLWAVAGGLVWLVCAPLLAGYSALAAILVGGIGSLIVIGTFLDCRWRSGVVSWFTGAI